MILDEDIDNLLMRYLLEEADVDERVRVEEWIKEDEEHLAYYQEFQGLHLRLQWTEQAREIKTDYPRFERRWRGKRGVRIVYRCAASIILLLGIGVAFWLQDVEPMVEVAQESIQPGKSQAMLYMASGEVIRVERDARELREADGTRIEIDPAEGMAYHISEKEKEKVLYNRIVVPKGGEFKLTLADGTRVWLNSRSELRYPVSFTGDRREVALSGEAYFEVTKDEAHPFVVAVNDMEVKVLGTRFNVNAQSEGFVKTVLVEGCVNVKGKEGQVVLHPNQMAEYREGDGRLHVANVDVLPYVAWKDGNFIFKGESLGSIMDKLSVWYDLDVFYTNEELKDIRLSGNLLRYEDVTKLFSSFERISAARFGVRGKSVTVSYN